MVQNICCQSSEEKNNENQYHAAKAAASEHARLRDAMAAESADEYQATMIGDMPRCKLRKWTCEKLRG